MIEVKVDSLKVIQVIEQGPQGPQGLSSGDGHPSHIAISNSYDTQALARHDGTDSTETTVEFGSFSDAHISGVSGVLTVIDDISEMTVSAEIQVQKTGGSIAKLVVWAEYSADGGATWLLRPGSGRHVSINNDSEGLHNYDFSSVDTFPAGVKLRLRATNEGGGNLVIQPTNLAVSTGVISGAATKITLQYR